MKRRFLNILAIMVVLIAGFSVKSYAAIGSPGGAWYMEDDGIMYMNPINGRLNFPSDFYQYRDEIIGLVIGDGTKYIGDSAFDQMDNLEWVYLPDGLQTISRNAFYDCPKLTSISIPDSVTKIESCAFWNCTGLTQATLSTSLTELPDIFKNCSSLKSVVIPDGVTSLVATFSGCSSLESIVIPESVTTITGAFSGCSSLKEVSIPDSVTAIGASTFKGCSSLTEIALPEGITVIEANSFNGCTGIMEIELPPNLTTIGFAAFASSGLTEIHIPETVVTLDNHAFYECADLKNITLPTNPDLALGYEVFYGTSFVADPTNWDNGILYLGKAVILGDPEVVSGALTLRPDTVTMAERAFRGCKEITEIVFPSGLTCIPDQAFLYCYKITSVTFPESLTYIGESAFEGATPLSEIRLPEGIQKIGFAAFYCCAESQSIYILNPDAKIDRLAFGHLYGPVQGEGPMADAVIYGYKDSTAETYANANGLSFVALDQVDPITGTCGENITWTLDGQTLTLSGTGPMTCPEDGWPWKPHANSFHHLVIQEGITTVGDMAFYGYPVLESVVIPGSVTTIEDNAFFGCSGLSDVTLSSGLASIGTYAFGECTALKSMSLPDSVTELSPRVFDGCSALETISLGNGITAIPEGTFSFCTALKEITIPDSVTSIDTGAFYQCRSLSSIDFGSGIKTIGSYAFQLSGLAKITLPRSLTTIGANAFDGCKALKKVTISQGLVSIGNYAFTGCTALKDINIPDSVQHIGDSAIPSTVYMGQESFCRDGLYYIDNALVYADKNLVGDIIIPEGTTCIADAAFARCEKITHISVPEGIEAIPSLMFYHTIGLKSVILPESVLEIAAKNFVDYNGVPLENITIYGCPDSYALEFAAERGYAFVALEAPFTDLVPSAFYYNPVVWAYQNQITSGTTQNSFNPNGECNRAQVVTFLWRAAGKPTPTSTENPFTDVEPGSFYYEAVLWAVEKGITNGMTPTTFAPNATCNRAQVVTFLWRAADQPAPTSTENPFVDVEPGSFYYEAVLWAVEKGITNGTTPTTFDPIRTCNRGQVVTFLFRYAG